ALRAGAAADRRGLRLPLADIFANPTIATQALVVATARSADTTTLVPDAGRWGEPFGLTDVQHAYWLGRSGLFELGDVSTHVYLELESGNFDPVRARVVLGRLVERHGMLRAVVRSDGRQQVLDVADVVVRVGFEDLGGLSVEEAWARVGVVRERLSHEVRPAEVCPLFEVFGQRLPDGLVRVHLSIDMLVADAASVRILLAEWAELYADPEVELGRIGVSFRDYCLAVEAAGEDAGARAYWLGRLDSLPAAPELPLVVGGVRGATRFVRREHRLDGVRWGRLRGWAMARGVTPSVVLCAAFAEALALWAKEPRFTLNVTTGDRLPLHPDVERLIGDFTNLVLLEVDTSGGGSFADRVRVLQRRLLTDLEHRAFGGVRMIRALMREHGPERASMPVVFTSVLGHEMPGGEDGVLPGLGSLVSAVSQTPQVHLDCQVVEVGGELMVSWDAVEA
ncbi:condensation domain-containing protein, partial [Kitasatospora sp. NPDC056327]|uniref:condensation domain-containing protein n=1 Tax=Kitasatospora sp. NPDC056327 TaxID=3345785 RepID=UPI0035DB5A90